MANISTSVPPLVFTPTGFQSPLESAILAGVQQDINTAFGGNLSANLSTPQGQLASSEAAIIGNTNDEFVNLSQQMDPAYNVGRFQDAIGRIYFMTRIPATATTLTTYNFGLPGVVIPAGALVQDASGNAYANAGNVTIPVGGNVTATFACTNYGPIAVPEGNLSIYTSIPGWDSCSFVSGVEGANVENRSAFEARRAASVAGNSFGPIGAIIGCVAAVPGVLDYWGYSNNTSGNVTAGNVTIAANSIFVSVYGGNSSAVATAILDKKSPGAPMQGNTTVTVYDSNPLYAAPIPYNITYTIPAPLQFVFAINVANSTAVPSNAATLIQQTIIGIFNGNSTSGNVSGNYTAPMPRIGSQVLAGPFYGPISALGSWAQIRSIYIGTQNTAASTFTGNVSGMVLNAIGNVSGNIAVPVSQVLIDANGLVVPGTIINANLSGNGSIGNYSLSGGNQSIGNETMFGVIANQTFVWVHADQIPQVQANNIFVTIT